MNKFIVKLKEKQKYKELKTNVCSSKNELFCCPLKKYLKSIN